MSAITDFETQLDAVVTAITAGDYTTAKTALIKARVYLAKIPTITGHGGGYVHYQRSLDDLQRAIADLEQISTSTGDLRRFIKVGTGFQT